MLLRQCLLAFSALTAAACLTLFDAKASLAATFYNFQLNFNDGTTGNGSFSIDEAAPPSYSGTYSENGWVYDYKQWGFLEFNFTYAGTTYNKSDLSYSGLANYVFPTTSNYYPYYGDTLKNFSFQLPGFYGAGSEYSQNSTDYNFVYGSVDSSGAYVTSGSWQQVPTPALLPGLIGMGVVALRKRKKEAVAESVDEPIAA